MIKKIDNVLSLFRLFWKRHLSFYNYIIMRRRDAVTCPIRTQIRSYLVNVAKTLRNINFDRIVQISMVLRSRKMKYI